MFISYVKPHKAISRDTLRRRRRNILEQAGIDLSVFSSHSTRSASTSYAKNYLSLETVLKTAGWSMANTFDKFYNLPVRDNFGEAILRAHAAT